MKNPCDRCQRYLLCPAGRVCVAWFWWFASRLREIKETLTEIAESEVWFD